MSFLDAMHESLLSYLIPLIFFHSGNVVSKRDMPDMRYLERFC